MSLDAEIRALQRAGRFSAPSEGAAKVLSHIVRGLSDGKMRQFNPRDYNPSQDPAIYNTTYITARAINEQSLSGDVMIEVDGTASDARAAGEWLRRVLEVLGG